MLPFSAFQKRLVNCRHARRRKTLKCAEPGGFQDQGWETTVLVHSIHATESLWCFVNMLFSQKQTILTRHKHLMNWISLLNWWNWPQNKRHYHFRHINFRPVCRYKDPYFHFRSFKHTVNTHSEEGTYCIISITLLKFFFSCFHLHFTLLHFTF